MVEVIRINGLLITDLKQITHPKGNILHGMKKNDVGFLGFGEAYFSTIKTGVIKAWKRHNEMTLNLIVPVGEVRFVFYDGRKDSNTFNQFNEIIISNDNYKRLTIPPGVSMGFQGLGKGLNMLLNIADIAHDPNEQINTPIEDSNINFSW